MTTVIVVLSDDKQVLSFNCPEVILGPKIFHRGLGQTPCNMSSDYNKICLQTRLLERFLFLSCKTLYDYVLSFGQLIVVYRI